MFRDYAQLQAMLARKIADRQKPTRKVLRTNREQEQSAMKDTFLRQAAGFFQKHRSMNDVRQESTEGSLLNGSVDERSNTRESRKPRDKLPLVLFASSKEEAVPGPGEYNVTIGDIGEKLRKGFGVTMKSRHGSLDSFEKTPGPAAYDVMKARPKNLKNAFSIGRSKREGKLDTRELIKPGPLDYNTNLPYRIKGTVVFNSIQAPKVGNDIPGPGTYIFQGARLLKRAPKYGFSAEKRFMSQSLDNIADGAGPAGYRPNFNSTKTRIPRATFGTASRKDLEDKSFSPGVGKYRPEDYKPRNTGSVIFSAEKRFMQNLKVILK